MARNADRPGEASTRDCGPVVSSVVDLLAATSNRVSVFVQVCVIEVRSGDVESPRCRRVESCGTHAESSPACRFLYARLVMQALTLASLDCPRSRSWLERLKDNFVESCYYSLLRSDTSTGHCKASTCAAKQQQLDRYLSTCPNGRRSFAVRHSPVAAPRLVRPRRPVTRQQYHKLVLVC